MDYAKQTMRPPPGTFGGGGGISDEDAPRLSPLRVIWHRRWVVVATALVCVAVAGVASRVMPKSYTRTSQIVIEPASVKAMAAGSFSMEAYLNTQAELIGKSAAIHADAINLLTQEEPALLHDFVPSTPDKLARLRQNLTATPGKNDNLITVAYTSRYPDEAARVVNAVVEAYATFTAGDAHKPGGGDNLKSLAADREQGERKLHEQNTQLAQLKGEISRLQADKDVSSAELQSLRTLSEALATAELDSINAQASFEEFAKLHVPDPAKLDALLTRGQYNGATVSPAHDGDQVKTDLYAAQRRLDELNERYLPNHPAVQAAQAKVDDLTASMVLLLHRKWTSASDRVKLLRDRHDTQQKHVTEATEQVAKALATKTVEYDEIERTLADTRHQSDLLNTRMEDLASADRISAARVSVLDKPNPYLAVPPTRPNTPAMLLEGLIVGLILGMGLALIDPRVRSVEEVISATALPVTGVIPRMRRNLSLQSRGRKVHLDPMSDVSEAYRAIRSALFFGPKGKTVLITSPTRAEGKSTTAANVAIALAEAGQRVLLVDADLRSPIQHRIFAVTNDTGIANVVAGRTSVDRAIQSSGIRGLDILPCGTVPMNPAETVNNQAFADLLAELSRRYEYVIVDSPPVMTVTDARILGAMCDATLLVVRAEWSSKRAAQDARDGLLGFGANILGVIVNDGPRNRQRYGYYGGYSRPVSTARGTGGGPTGGEMNVGVSVDAPVSMNTDLMFSPKR